MVTEAPGSQRGITLDLGFTVGLEMDFDEAIKWAANEGFDIVEVLLDGPYARERITGRCDSMAKTLMHCRG